MHTRDEFDAKVMQLSDMYDDAVEMEKRRNDLAERHLNYDTMLTEMGENESSKPLHFYGF